MEKSINLWFIPDGKNHKNMVHSGRKNTYPLKGVTLRVFTRVMSRSDGRKPAQELLVSPTEHNMTKANFKIVQKVRS